MASLHLCLIRSSWSRFVPGKTCIVFIRFTTWSSGFPIWPLKSAQPPLPLVKLTRQSRFGRLLHYCSYHPTVHCVCGPRCVISWSSVNACIVLWFSRSYWCGNTSEKGFLGRRKRPNFHFKKNNGLTARAQLKCQGLETEDILLHLLWRKSSFQESLLILYQMWFALCSNVMQIFYLKI